MPAADGENVQDIRSFSQGKYPQPPEWTQNIVVSQTPWPAPGEEGNVSVKLNKSEKQIQQNITADETESAPKKEWPMWLQIGIVILFAVLVVLLGKNIVNKITSDYEQTDIMQDTVAVVPNTVTTVPTTVVPVYPSTDKYTTAEPEKDITASDKEKTTAQNSQKPSFDSSKNDNNNAEVKKKVVEYFNESSNRVKTEAKKVIKNFENRTHNEDKLNLPSAIKGVAKSVLESKITDITEPVEYPTPEAIIAKYPVPGQEWSSNLTADDVAEATCVEKGDKYEITLLLKDCVDPEPEKGTSRAMDCLDVPTVRDTAPPFVTAFSAEYYDCVIRCHIEKSTGRVIWSNYTAPVVIKVGLDAGFVKFDAEIGLTFEKDYTITY